MSSEEVPAGGPRLHRLAAWFDPESTAVLTMLLGLFQMMLSVLLFYTDRTLPNLFALPLISGILTVAGGSFSIANERSPSRPRLQGCACSNVIGLLGAVLAFCLYCYSLSLIPQDPCLNMRPPSDDDRRSHYRCPGEVLAAYSWSVTLQLMLYDSGAVVLQSLLSVSALKALKTD